MLNITICDGNSVQSEMIQAEIDRSLDSQISYNLQVFHDGKLFEHEITSRNCPYDIVILDIELGNSSKSGIELAREINCLNPETQIIFFRVGDGFCRRPLTPPDMRFRIRRFS